MRYFRYRMFYVFQWMDIGVCGLCGRHVPSRVGVEPAHGSAPVITPPPSMGDCTVGAGTYSWTTVTQKNVQVSTTTVELVQARIL